MMKRKAGSHRRQGLTEEKSFTEGRALHIEQGEGLREGRQGLTEGKVSQIAGSHILNTSRVSQRAGSQGPTY